MKYTYYLFIPCLIILYTINQGCIKSSEPTKSFDNVEKKSQVEDQKVSVEVSPVRFGDFEQELIANGSVLALRKAKLEFDLNEVVEHVYVYNGQYVKKGELIAKLNAFECNKELERAHNEYNKALIDLEDQLLGYGYELRDSASIPPNTFMVAKIRSNYLQSLSNLNDAERKLGSTSLRAPFSGTIANLKAREFNQSSEFDYCCELIDNRVMQLEFSILEREITHVRKGQSVTVTPFVSKDKHYTGTIVAVNPCVNEEGMITILAEVKNPEGLLLDGMNVKILSKNSIPNAVVIPKSAVLYRQNRQVVFVHEEGRAKWVYVEIGEENSSEVTIVNGSLKEGQEVIVSNNLNLAHGTQVVCL